MYEKRNETPPRELIAFRATADPRLISDNSAVMKTVRQTARSGMSHPGVTRDSQVEPGRPRSRAKDLNRFQQLELCSAYGICIDTYQSCLDDVATSLITQHSTSTTRIAAMTLVPA